LAASSEWHFPFFLKGEGFLKQLRNYQLLKNVCFTQDGIIKQAQCKEPTKKLYTQKIFEKSIEKIKVINQIIIRFS
jgi:hypothetical protein